MKICKTCKLSKELTEFFTASKYKDKQYYRRECKECTRIELRSESGRKAQEKYRKSEWGFFVKNQYKKDRKKNDPFFRLKENLRRRLRSALKSKSWRKTTKFYQYIGCTLEEFKLYLEAKFTEGMTWDNYGKWHIDHIIPMDSANTEEELIKLCHYTNLQPLWAVDNMKKSNK